MHEISRRLALLTERQQKGRKGEVPDNKHLASRVFCTLVFMAAYVISEVRIIDSELGEKYKTLAARSIAEYGGKYIVRGAEAKVAEGAPTDQQIVIVEFPTMAQIEKWYASPAYAEALKIRQTALERRLIFVEGVTPVKNF